MITFIIQFRYDSEDRIRNLQRGVIYLSSNFRYNSQILIIDQDNNSNLLKDIFLSHEETKFSENIDIHSLNKTGPYHRSKVINEGLRLAKYNLCLIYDCDILLPTDQIATSIKLATSGYDVVYPFTSPQYDISKNYFSNFEKTYNFEKIMQDFSPRKWGEPDYLMAKHGHAGFGMLINKTTAKNLGFFNEDFNGWGFEDGEFLFRLDKFGAKITRAPGPIFHVDHDRSLQYKAQDYTNMNEKLYKRLQSLKYNELVEYYKERNLIN